MDQLRTLFQIFVIVAAACRENMPNSREAWSRIVMDNPPHRCLHREYLPKKCKLLEEMVSAAKGGLISCVQQEAQGRA